MNIQLRAVTLKDIPEIEALHNQLVIHERPLDPTIPQEGKVLYYDLKKLITSDKVSFLIAEVDRKVVGCGFGEIKPDYDWSIQKYVGYIGLMVIDTKYRKKGVGKLIMNSLLEWFKKKNILDVRLEVYSENIGSIEAYKKYGFKDFLLIMRRELSQ